MKNHKKYPPEILEQTNNAMELDERIESDPKLNRQMEAIAHAGLKMIKINVRGFRISRKMAMKMLLIAALQDLKDKGYIKINF